MNKILNGIYQNRADKLVYYEKLLKLLKECEKLNMFDYVADLSMNDEKLEENRLYCIREKGAVVNGRVMEESFYLFYGNTCVIYDRAGFDDIIRIKVKEPNDFWRLDVCNYGENDDWNHVHILNKNIDVYCRWDVDWMGFGKRDSQGMSKNGSWWKFVCTDIATMYETVAKRSMDYLFNQEYQKVTSKTV